MKANSEVSKLDRADVDAPKYAQIGVFPDVHFRAEALASLRRMSRESVLIFNEEDVDAANSAIVFPECDAIVAAWYSVLSSSVLRKFPSLRIAALRTSSLQKVDLDHVARRNIRVVPIHGFGDIGTAEFVTEQLLVLARQRRIKEGKLPSELHGRKLGLIGFGTMGSIVAGIASSLGMDVRYWVPNPSRKTRSLAAKYLPLTDLLAGSDYISFHSPAFAQILNAADLHLVRPDTGLIVTTLGLPFPLGAFLEWAPTSGCPAIFDFCAAHGHEEALSALPLTYVDRLPSGRTAEMPPRAERMVIDNLRGFLVKEESASPTSESPKTSSAGGVSWNG